MSKRRFSKTLGRKTHSDTEKAISTLSEEEALELIRTSADEPFLLILDQVQDPRNLGACLRSADAAGVTLVIIPADRSAGISEVVRHVAAGAAETLNIARVRNLANFMKELNFLGIKLLGTSDQAKHSLYEVDWTGPMALIMGAEGSGIRRLTADKCDELIQIPMKGSVHCLNVSVATGVCLFEGLRQRSRGKFSSGL